MRLKSLFTVLVIVFAASTASAQPFSWEVGISPIFANLSSSMTFKKGDVSLNDDLGIGKNYTFLEGNAAVYTRTMKIRGYWLFPKSDSSIGPLPAILATKKSQQGQDKEFATTNFSFKSNRLEAGTPIYFDKYIYIEPFLVYQNLCPNISINHKDFNHCHDTKHNSFGAGVYLIDRISYCSSLSVKAFFTAHVSYFDLKANYLNGPLFCGAGYTWRVFNMEKINMRLSGPSVSVGLVF